MASYQDFNQGLDNSKAASPSTAYNPSTVGSEKGTLSGLNFLKNLSLESKQTKDGLPAKRRGPKPDSKPALTRRQELNRQAQRTHRERKEMYIKTLEHEVMRVKETYSETSRARDALNEENRQLKDLLTQHGIVYDPTAAAAVAFKPSPDAGLYAAQSHLSSVSPPQHSSPLQLDSMAAQAPFTSPVDAHLAGIPQLQQTSPLDLYQAGLGYGLTYDAQGQPIQHAAPYPSPPPQL